MEWYATRLLRLGFALADERLLRVRMSEIASQFVRRWVRHGHEGAPVSKTISAGERATLLVTKPLDRVLPARAGLCRMTFRRTEPETSHRRGVSGAGGNRTPVR